MTELTIRKPDDFHNHLRQGDMMPHLVRECAKVFARSNAMPNLTPPVVTPDDVKAYHQDLKNVGTDLEFLMTFKVMPTTSPDMIPALKAAGAIAGKLYPQGVSVNSEDGVTDISALYPTFKAMEEANVLLLIHGEMPETDDMQAEGAFLPTFQDIVKNFPKLRIVFEHTSSKAAVELIKELPETVASTITIQHLLITIDDVRTEGVVHHPHSYCRPICKTEADRKALVEVIMSGHPRFFLGTDSAPHPRETKEGAGEPNRGVYTTPVALPLLAQLFEDHEKLSMLEDYTSRFGAEFYQLPLNTGEITLQKQGWTVPEEYFGVVPFKAGEALHWQIQA